MSLLLIVNSIFLKSFSVCSASLGQTLVGKIKLGLGWGKTEQLNRGGREAPKEEKPGFSWGKLTIN